MQAAVAVRLGIGNVVLLLDQRQVVLPHEHVRYRVNILDKRTDYTDTANIVQIIYHGLQRDRKSAPLELADNAARALMRLLMASIGLGLPEIRDSSLRISSLVLISRMPDSYSIIICCICIADSISSSSSCCDSRSIAKSQPVP